MNIIFHHASRRGLVNAYPYNTNPESSWSPMEVYIVRKAGQIVYEDLS